MNCKSCGNPLTGEDKFCKKCGTPVAVANQPAAQPVQQAQPAPMAQPVAQPARPVVQPAVQAQPMGQPMAQPMGAPMGQPAIRPVGPTPMPGAYQAPPQKKGANPILMVVLALVAFAVGYFGYKLLSGGGSVVAAETTSITVGGYTFQAPIDMVPRYSGGGVTLSNDKINVAIQVNSGKYEDVQAASSSVTFEGEKTYNGTKYKLYSAKSGSHNGKLFAYALSSNKYGVVAVTVGNDETQVPSSKHLEAALKIATSAKAASSRSAQIGGFDQDEMDEIMGSFKAKDEEETSTGDIGEDVYEDIYVNITLDEINE